MDIQEKIVSWLKDAHAIERGSERALAHHARDAAGFPVLQRRLKRHVAETRRHAEAIERYLNALGVSHAPMEAAVAKAMGAAQAALVGLLGDELLTNTSADYALESLEIATYTAILAAAEKARDQAAARLCRRILRDEVSMAAWLKARLAGLTRSYLAI